MAGRRTQGPALSRRPPDLDNLPLTLKRGGGVGPGIFVMLFALVWGGVPGCFLVSEWQTLDEDVIFVGLFPLIGLALFLFGLVLSFRLDRVSIDLLAVRGEIRSLTGRRRWQEPLARYRGVLIETVAVGNDEDSRIEAHAVVLAHREAEKKVVLYVTRDKLEARREWERAARALRLAALEATGDGEVERELEDVGKSVRELAAEGKLETDFQARPPPDGLSARYEGEALVVTTTRPRFALPELAELPRKAWIALAIVLAVLYVLFDLFVVVVIACLGGFYLWHRHVREELAITRDGVETGWVAPFGRGKRRRLPAERIEAVRVVAAESLWRHLAIAGDAEVLRFAFGQPEDALEWAREAVLAHVAAPGGEPAGA